MNDRNLPLLSSLPAFDTLYTCEPRDLPRCFNVITMVHALEHFPSPIATLRDLRTKIAPGGRLFVEVPNAEANPYEYLIADHAVHFTPATLGLLVGHAGWRIEQLSTSWVAKELSLTAYPAGTEPAETSLPAAASDAASRIRGQIDWLRRNVDAAWKASTESSRFGLFGSSIASTWMCGVLGEKVSFFVEEDQHRVGRSHMGRPILSPDGVPSDGVVYIGLLPQIADRIAARLGNTLKLRLPPAF
jgi:Methyltransferase domain